MELSKYRPRKGEIEGKWFELGDGARVKLAGANHPEYVDALQDALEHERDLFRRAARPGAPEELKKRARKRRLEIVRRLIATHLVLDWEGIAENGRELPFSRENAVRVMEQYPRFADMVAELVVDGFEDEAALDDEGVENLKNA